MYSEALIVACAAGGPIPVGCKRLVRRWSATESQKAAVMVARRQLSG
jgi:hypothetical protein